MMSRGDRFDAPVLLEDYNFVITAITAVAATNLQKNINFELQVVYYLNL